MSSRSNRRIGRARLYNFVGAEKHGTVVVSVPWIKRMHVSRESRARYLVIKKGRSWQRPYSSEIRRRDAVAMSSSGPMRPLVKVARWLQRYNTDRQLTPQSIAEEPQKIKPDDINFLSPNKPRSTTDMVLLLYSRSTGHKYVCMHVDALYDSVCVCRVCVLTSWPPPFGIQPRGRFA